MADTNTNNSDTGKTGNITNLDDVVRLLLSHRHRGTDTPKISYKDLTDESKLVKTTGDQTIGGVKTFTSFPVTPSSAPTTDYQAANKKYVDDNASNIYDYFHYTTLYESFDNFYSAYATYTAGPYYGYVTLDTGATSYTEAHIYKALNYSGSSHTLLSWEKDRRIRFDVEFGATTNQHFIAGTGILGDYDSSNESNWTSEHIAFFLYTPNELYGHVGVGSARGIVNLNTTITTGHVYKLEIRHTALNEVNFYVDGELKGTIGANLLDGQNYVEAVLGIILENTADEDKWIHTSYYEYIQKL